MSRGKQALAGTALLPTLFNCSFVLTVVATPLTSAFLSRAGVKRWQAVRQLFSLFALSVLGFFLLYQAVSVQQRAAASTSAQDVDLQRQISDVDLQRQLSDVDLQRPISEKHLQDANSTSQALDSAANQARTGDPSLTPAQRAVRIAFYLWLGLLNLLATSTLWARAADAFDSSAASRLFGFLGAGATMEGLLWQQQRPMRRHGNAGQLAGSVTAATWASSSPAGTETHGPQDPPLGPLLVSAVLLEAAGRLAANMQASDSFERLGSQSSKHRHMADSLEAKSGRRDGQSNQHQQGSPSKLHLGYVGWDLTAVKQGLWQAIEGVRLIARSGYLCHVCMHFVLHYVVSTFFYFEKTLVVARSGGSASQRVATFANINSMSAGAVALIQLTATGRLLGKLGTAWSLAAAPLISVALMAATAAFPNIIVISIGEIVRKVVNYSLTRPAREILYTVLTIEEKYKAKVCIDTIILRMGDSIGAAVFRILDRLLGFGPAGLAATATPICVAWCAVALQLGRKQQHMSSRQNFHR